ncbi:hypothetical protein UF64_02530 [Thalassospira sp. HJ]|uniref:hypothetical protein n=1 Tax=Thalassospira sp. HJ TaxID=1616823 RepID=UPI0005CE0ED4|nr:hypothetical protein [Thalassospira sp. HJ]KJE36586.1 hypothetical protein UF64_02530 [Thalassospira sp. HJ]
MNIFNLLQGLRDALFPAIMFALLLLGSVVTSPKAEVYQGDGRAPLSLLKQTASDGKITVIDVLKGSADQDVVKGATNPGGEQGNSYDLVLANGDAWQKDSDGEFVVVKVLYMGSVQKTCSVYAVKDGSAYKTKCQ